MAQDFWRLPKGVDEVLPPRARQLELLRRQVLDLFDSWGYDYIDPPMIEYLDALLVGNDLKLQTLQVADQVTGRTLGVRADMTSQAARIDANSLSVSDSLGKVTNDNTTRRLCYAGPLVRANPPGVLESRVPLKAGAEIYGCADVSADLEVICLAIDAVSGAGLKSVVIELGHVGFVRGLVDEALGSEISTGDLDSALYQRLLEAVRIKSEGDIKALLGECDVASLLCELVRLMGGPDALTDARALFATNHANMLELVDQLDYCAARLRDLRPNAQVRFDLSAPVGFGYHKALVFALYGAGYGQAIARGGRYDGIGEQFGNARPATGFDVNLKTLLGLPDVAAGFALSQAATPTVWVPFELEAPAPEELAKSIKGLRADGWRVVQALGEDDQPPEHCGYTLMYNEGWRLDPPLKNSGTENTDG